MLKRRKRERKKKNSSRNRQQVAGDGDAAKTSQTVRGSDTENDRRRRDKTIGPCPRRPEVRRRRRRRRARRRPRTRPERKQCQRRVCCGAAAIFKRIIILRCVRVRGGGPSPRTHTSPALGTRPRRRIIIIIRQSRDARFITTQLSYRRIPFPRPEEAAKI